MKRIGEWLPRLTHLDIADCFDITDRGLEFIGRGCSLLEHVDVSRCFDIIGPGIDLLASSCSHLHTVIARECFDMTSATIVYISLHCKHVRHLDVAFNLCVSDETMSGIAGDRGPDEGLVVVTEECPNVRCRHGEDGLGPGDQRRFRFIDWKGKENDAFVIWETSV